MLYLLILPNIPNLPNLEDHPILPRQIGKFKPLLANPLNPIGPYQRIRFHIYLIHDRTLILLLELIAQVWIHHRIDTLQLD